jgi:hypothetical protein
VASAQQTFVNDKAGPIYISIEPWPDCYELEPGERLTLIYAQPTEGDALTVSFINERELVIWPAELTPKPRILIDGTSAEKRNWKFKHR